MGWEYLERAGWSSASPWDWSAGTEQRHLLLVQLELLWVLSCDWSLSLSLTLSQAAGAPQWPPAGPAAAVPLRAGGGAQWPRVGEGLQRAADAAGGQPAAELRYHERPAEAPAVAQGGPGGAVE